MLISVVAIPYLTTHIDLAGWRGPRGVQNFQGYLECGGGARDVQVSGV